MILVILSKHNPLSSHQQKPVVSAMLPYVLFSEFFNDIYVLSPFTKSPNMSVNHIIFKKGLYNSQVVKKVKQLVREKKVTLIEVHQDMRLAGRIAKENPGIKVSLVKHSHGFKSIFTKSFFLHFYYYHKYIKYLNAIYCNSNYIKELFTKYYPLFRSKIFTTYNNYGYLFHELQKDKKTTINKKKQIVFSGKPNKNKGVIEFILSLERILSDNLSYKALIINSFSHNAESYIKEVKQALQRPKIQELIKDKRVILLKNLEHTQVFQHMRESDICIVPTKVYEAFGLVCLEAHLAKCAVVSSGKGGLKEVSESHAIYLDDITPDSISSAVNHLILNESKLNKIASEGYDHVYEKFSPKKIVKILDEKRREAVNEYIN